MWPKRLLASRRAGALELGAPWPETTSDSESGIETVAIVGVGLIGGSIAAALQSRNACRRVIGVGRDAAKLQPAVETGLLSEATSDLAAAAARSDLIVFCTPVDRIVDGVRTAGSTCRPGTVLTDAGSVKGGICESLATGLRPDVTFVGSYPLAGSEKSGFEHADADLFVDRVCVVTPGGNSRAEAVERVAGFWRCLGMTVVETSPGEHDRLLALTSHVPHIVAPALAGLLDPETAPFAASGFRDSTRVAGSDPALWTAIFRANQRAVEAGLEQFAASFDQFQKAVRDGDWNRLQKLLETAKRNRDGLDP